MFSSRPHPKPVITNGITKGERVYKIVNGAVAAKTKQKKIDSEPKEIYTLREAR